MNFRMSSQETTLPADPADEPEKKYWWYFVLSYVLSWAVCFVLILIPRIIVYTCNRPQRSQGGTGNKSARTDQVLVEPSFYSSIQNWAEDLISGNTTSGRILVVFAFLCSVTSFVIYVISKLLLSQGKYYKIQRGKNSQRGHFVFCSSAFLVQWNVKLLFWKRVAQWSFFNVIWLLLNSVTKRAKKPSVTILKSLGKLQHSSP